MLKTLIDYIKTNGFIYMNGSSSPSVLTTLSHHVDAE